jgi:hypothetical protein
MAYRPHNRHCNSFAKLEHLLAPINGPTMFWLNCQYTEVPGERPQWGVIERLFKFDYDVHSGRVYVDANRNGDCNPGVYDLALPVHRRMERHYLTAAINKTAADLALAMYREINRALDANEPILYQPTLPDFYFAFVRPPVFERSPVLVREASAALGMAPDQMSEDDLQTYFWSQRFEQDGMIFVPQRYLARQASDYAAHPIDGSPCPAGCGKPGEWQRSSADGAAWYFGDGRWNPAAQRPHRVYAHMGKVLGRPFRNPAFTVLKAGKLFPGELTYPEFTGMLALDRAPVLDANGNVVEEGRGPIHGPGGLHDRLREEVAANPATKDGLIQAMRGVMGQNGDMATDDDLANALDYPHLPMNLTFASGIWLVRYSGRSWTWQWPGGYGDFYAVKKSWAGRVEPADRGPAGGYRHGRASTPAAR